jgi:hypothetical protein
LPIPFTGDFEQAREVGYAIAGTPAEVRGYLLRRAKETRISYMACRFSFGDLTFEESKRSIDLFARDVLPSLQAHEAAPIL